jgi:hypothetical protein
MVATMQPPFTGSARARGVSTRREESRGRRSTRPDYDDLKDSVTYDQDFASQPPLDSRRTSSIDDRGDMLVEQAFGEIPEHNEQPDIDDTEDQGFTSPSWNATLFCVDSGYQSGAELPQAASSKPPSTTSRSFRQERKDLEQGPVRRHDRGNDGVVKSHLPGGTHSGTNVDRVQRDKNNKLGIARPEPPNADLGREQRGAWERTRKSKTSETSKVAAKKTTTERIRDDQGRVVGLRVRHSQGSKNASDDTNASSTGHKATLKKIGAEMERLQAPLETVKAPSLAPNKATSKTKKHTSKTGDASSRRHHSKH